MILLNYLQYTKENYGQTTTTALRANWKNIIQYITISIFWTLHYLMDCHLRCESTYNAMWWSSSHFLPWSAESSRCWVVVASTRSVTWVDSSRCLTSASSKSLGLALGGGGYPQCLGNWVEGLLYLGWSVLTARGMDLHRSAWHNLR